MPTHVLARSVGPQLFDQKSARLINSVYYLSWTFRTILRTSSILPRFATTRSLQANLAVRSSRAGCGLYQHVDTLDNKLKKIKSCCSCTPPLKELLCCLVEEYRDSWIRATPTNPSKFSPLLPQIRISHPDFNPHFSLLSNWTLISGSLFSLTYILYITCNYRVQYFISKLR